MRTIWLFPEVRGPFCGCPHKKSPTILGSVLAAPDFWRFPHVCRQGQSCLDLQSTQNNRLHDTLHFGIKATIWGTLEVQVQKDPRFQKRTVEAAPRRLQQPSPRRYSAASRDSQLASAYEPGYLPLKASLIRSFGSSRAGGASQVCRCSSRQAHKLLFLGSSLNATRQRPRKLHCWRRLLAVPGRSARETKLVAAINLETCVTLPTTIDRYPKLFGFGESC